MKVLPERMKGGKNGSKGVFIGLLVCWFAGLLVCWFAKLAVES